MAFVNGKSGEMYNISGKNEQNNNYKVASIYDILDQLKPLENNKYSDQISYVEDRAGHDYRYAIDATKLLKI